MCNVAPNFSCCISTTMCPHKVAAYETYSCTLLTYEDTSMRNTSSGAKELLFLPLPLPLGTRQRNPLTLTLTLTLTNPNPRGSGKGRDRGRVMVSLFRVGTRGF